MRQGDDSGIRSACLALVGGAKFADLLIRGRISSDSAWVGMRGAVRYVRAIAAGDVADAGTAADRLNICAGCDAVQPDVDHPDMWWWCGRAFLVETTKGRESCGCLLQAKVSVAGEDCPRGKWLAT